MIKEKIQAWKDLKIESATPLGQTGPDILGCFTRHFSARQVLDCVDVWIDTESERPKDAFDNGGAVFATVVWLLNMHHVRWSTKMVDQICEHFGFDYRTVSPRCALRKAMSARLHLREADKQLSRLWPVDRDLVETIVCKLDNVHDVYELNTDVLDTVLHN